SGWSLEGARLQAAPYIVFKDLRHGWEAVPFQNSNAESFSASCSAVPQIRRFDPGSAEPALSEVEGEPTTLA
ncbi:MAG TPA: hypothetical protein VN948_00735, partial [Terriglobales bacterium]|nr:hypothetical protein [Terriglobales bacterium]